MEGSGDHDPAYLPMMPNERVEILRRWHENALEGARRTETITTTFLGRTFVVPPEVIPPNPMGLGESVLLEVRENDRVLDMGTGCGVNGILAASKSRQVVAVDVNPIAVECAKGNAKRNGVANRVVVRESDIFQNLSGKFDLILFDPPFRWFRPGTCSNEPPPTRTIWAWRRSSDRPRVFSHRAAGSCFSLGRAGTSSTWAC